MRSERVGKLINIDGAAGRKCARCGESMPPGMKFCGKCGAKAETKKQGAICPKCGADVGVGLAFCAVCGTRLEPFPSPPDLKSPNKTLTVAWDKQFNGIAGLKPYEVFINGKRVGTVSSGGYITAALPSDVVVVEIIASHKTLTSTGLVNRSLKVRMRAGASGEPSLSFNRSIKDNAICITGVLHAEITEQESK